MKKVLITGMNKAQVERNFYLRQELKVVSPLYSLAACFEDMGWQVDQRPAVIGEDLSVYDEVVTYVHSPRAFAHALYCGLYAVAARPDSIIAIEDWQADQIRSSIRQYQRELTGEAAAEPFKDYYFELFKYHDKETVVKYKDHYLAATKRFLEGDGRLLYGGYAGGDTSLVKIGWDPERTYTYNPNPYNLNRLPSKNVHVQDKRENWIFTSLVHNKSRIWMEKQSPKWSVDYYGSRRGQFKCERVTEDVMVDRFAESWGVIATPYYHSGCGWWRSRVLQTADAGSILLCNDKEGALYSDAHVGNTIESIEALSFEQRVKLAKDQRDGLYERHPLDKKAQQREIERVLEAPR